MLGTSLQRIKGEMKSTIATTDSTDILTPTQKVKFNHNIDRILSSLFQVSIY